MSREAMLLLSDASGMGILELRRAMKVAGELYGGDLLLGAGHVHAVSLAVVRKGTPQGIAASIRREAEGWVNRLRRLPGWDEEAWRMALEAGLPDEHAAQPASRTP